MPDDDSLKIHNEGESMTHPGFKHDEGTPIHPTHGLSHTPGLVSDGDHVRGPQQAPVDPIRAGLDTAHLDGRDPVAHDPREAQRARDALEQRADMEKARRGPGPAQVSKDGDQAGGGREPPNSVT